MRLEKAEIYFWIAKIRNAILEKDPEEALIALEDVKAKLLEYAFDGKTASEQVQDNPVQEDSDKNPEDFYSCFEEDLGNPQINNPTHYQSMVKELDIDAISCMRAAFGDNDVKAFCLCNSMKYIFRSSSKGQNQSIAKAVWYLNKFLELGGYE